MLYNIIVESHCSDLYSRSVNDTPEMAASKDRIFELVRQWLGISEESTEETTEGTTEEGPEGSGEEISSEDLSDELLSSVEDF